MNSEDETLERPLPINDERTQHVRIRVRRTVPGRRLDTYLRARYTNLSRTAIQRLIRQKTVRVNDKFVKASAVLHAGDTIELHLPDPEPPEVVPEDIPVDVLYEDEHIIAINKQAGIICHPARASQSGTIVNALAFYADKLSSGSAPYRPGIVHRLDKNTTGVMLVAKCDEAHWRLSQQFERRTIQKTYLAVATGELALDGDTIDAPLGVHPVVREKFAVLVRDNKINIARNAVTRYEVSERFRGYTLVTLFPKTGRTHQLRVHMSHIGHPLVGDGMYGGKAISEKRITGEGSDEAFLKHQALHAWKIRFTHPITEREMEIQAPFHAELKRLVLLLRRARSV